MENLSRRTFLAFTAGAFITPPIWPAEARVAGFPALLDHILLGCNDLDRGIAFVEEVTGVRASFGGVHPGRGTQNALISLGERTPQEPNPRRYLEIIAPDPKQSGVQQYSAITKLNEPRLIGWAAHRDDLDQFAARLRKEGIEFEGPQPGSRQRPDGKVLHWKALRLKDDRGGLLPFFIEWSADTTHPSVDAPRGCHLESFTLLAPDPDALSKTADQLELGVTTSKAAEFQIRAVIACAGKELRLTSRHFGSVSTLPTLPPYCSATHPPCYTLEPVPGTVSSVDRCLCIWGPAPGQSGESRCLSLLRGIYR